MSLPSRAAACSRSSSGGTWEGWGGVGVGRALPGCQRKNGYAHTPLHRPCTPTCVIVLCSCVCSPLTRRTEGNALRLTSVFVQHRVSSLTVQSTRIRNARTNAQKRAHTQRQSINTQLTMLRRVLNYICAPTRQRHAAGFPRPARPSPTCTHLYSHSYTSMLTVASSGRFSTLPREV